MSTRKSKPVDKLSIVDMLDELRIAVKHNAAFCHTVLIDSRCIVSLRYVIAALRASDAIPFEDRTFSIN